MRRRALSLAALANWLLTRSPAHCALAIDDDIRRWLAERVEEARQARAVVIGLVSPNQRRVISYASLGPGRPPNGSSVFEIGSVTKVFTALLLADMVRRGEVALDDPVRRYLGAEGTAQRSPILVKHRGEPVTLVDLATHRSGLPNFPGNFRPKDWTNPHADYTPKQLRDFLSSYEPAQDAGTKFLYSNLGFGVLGHALSRRAGQSFEELVHSRITGPLGMRDTRSTPTDDMIRRLAPGHDSKLARARSWHTHTLAGSGGLRSTADDLMVLLEAFLGLRPSPLETSMRAMLETQRSGGLPPSTHTGLGWMLFKSGDQLVACHPGRTGGYRSFLGYNPSTRIGVVALADASTDMGFDDIALHLLDPRFPLVKPGSARR